MASLFSSPKLPPVPPPQRMPVEQSQQNVEAANARRLAEQERMRGGGRAQTELSRRAGGGKVLGT